MSCNSSVTHVQLSTLGRAERTTVHLMPCEIEYNGSAQVSQYLTSTIKDCKQEKTVSFRGRGLRGTELSCPQGYTGLVLKEVNPNGSDQEDRTVKVTFMFDKLTYWNLETPPNSDDTVVMAMDWPELAEAGHRRRGVCGCGELRLGSDVEGCVREWVKPLKTLMV